MGDCVKNDWEEQAGGDINALCGSGHLRSILDDQCGGVVWTLQYTPLQFGRESESLKHEGK